MFFTQKRAGVVIPPPGNLYDETDTKHLNNQVVRQNCSNKDLRILKPQDCAGSSAVRDTSNNKTPSSQFSYRSPDSYTKE